MAERPDDDDDHDETGGFTPAKGKWRVWEVVAAVVLLLFWLLVEYLTPGSR